MGSETLHEKPEKMGEETVDQHRAIVSLMEELEAVDWYNQRVHATENAELREILAHNRDEEMEHAAMVLEWLRRRIPKLDAHLKTYLNSEGSILAVEKAAEEGGGAGSGAGDGSLRIGSLREGGGRQ
ncbi:MAG: encapsulin-associated ferritin-like protein [Dongiaceae bacterium]